MKTIILAIAAGAALAYAAFIAAQFIRRAILRGRQRIFELRRVTLEQVTYFKVRGCKHCGGSGEVKRRAQNSQKLRLPCECAAKAFLAIYSRDTKMLGPFRVWKRGRGPRRVSRPEARAKARAATA